MNIWKMFLTWPYFVLSFPKAKKWAKRIRKDPNSVLEETRYYWIKKKVRYLLWLCDLKIVAEGLENWIDKGVLLAGNHQSNFDPLIMLRLNDFDKTAPAAFLAKKEIQDRKHWYNFASLIDVLFLDRKNPRQAMQIMQEANELIRIPRSLVIFPEGHRSKSAKMLPFQHAAFKIAQRANVPIVPFTIVNSYTVNIRKQSPNYVLIIFDQPLKPQTFIHNPTAPLSNKVQSIIANNLKKYEGISHKELKRMYKANKKKKKSN